MRFRTIRTGIQLPEAAVPAAGGTAPESGGKGGNAVLRRDGNRRRRFRTAARIEEDESVIAKKICMLGAYSVGKTSLVERYVRSIFSDRYLSTVGVKISKKNLMVRNEEISLVLWDMEGKDDYSEVNLSYLRGAMGFFLVADGTRGESLDIAMELRTLACGLVGDIPHILLINKADLAPSWEISEDAINGLEGQGLAVMRTSAKTGQSVDEAFVNLASAMYGGKRG
jgi:small GTP-binding protein